MNTLTGRLKRLLLAPALLSLFACSIEKIPPSDLHITQKQPNAENPQNDIPAPVTKHTFLPPPPAPNSGELFTVVVNDLPVREVLFALARDAGLNADIDDSIQGNLTINAIDQPLKTILERISHLASLRITQRHNTLDIASDHPYLETYHIDYINIHRKTESSAQVETQVASTGSSGSGSNGGNSSSSRLTNRTENDFWRTLISNVSAMLGDTSAVDNDYSRTVIPNRTAGLLSIRATATQHQQVETYLNSLIANAKRQVLVEATIVEIQLNNRYQSGVDWSILARSIPGFSFGLENTPTALASGPRGVLSYANNSSDLGNISAAISALETFGNVKVLSSPKLMMLNNQTSMLKVVDDRVYFTVDVNREKNDNGDETITVESTIHTVPIGLVMVVTPQISDDKVVTLNVRPSITRILKFVEDPNPELRGDRSNSNTAVPNLIPEVQVREIESVLSVADGETAVLGGLMQDTLQEDETNVPLVSKIPVVGKLFGAQDERISKTELLIFLKPTVVDYTPSSSNSRLSVFESLLPTLSASSQSQPTE